MKTNVTRGRSVSTVVVWTLAAAAGLLLFSCTPGSELTVEESDVVVTVYDPSVDFSAITTYAMPDTVIHLLGEDEEDDDISREYDQAILDLIAANFDARGYVRIPEDSPDPPDVLVLVSATTTDYWYAYSYYGYWGGWYWGYPGYGWGYPYYPYYDVDYAYTTGTLIVEMVDPSNKDEINKLIAAYWQGVCNGILSGSQTEQRFADSINQMFIQSPYLRSSGE
jgi:hypothetical protein